MPNESPYATNHGNPIQYKDPTGDIGWAGALVGAVAGSVLEYGSQATSNFIQGKSWRDALWNEIDFADVGVSAAEGAAIGATGGAALIRKVSAAAVTKIAAGAARTSLDYTPKEKFKSVGGLVGDVKKTKALWLDAGSECFGGIVGKGFSKAGLGEFVTNSPRSLLQRGGLKQAGKAVRDEVITGTVETAVPTIVDGAVRGSVEADQPEPIGYEDNSTGEVIPFKSPSPVQGK